MGYDLDFSTEVCPLFVGLCKQSKGLCHGVKHEPFRQFEMCGAGFLPRQRTERGAAAFGGSERPKR